MEIKPLGPEQSDEAMSLLEAAFFDRPFYCYLAPDPVDRRDFMALNFRLRLEHGLEAGETGLVVLNQRISGLAVWLPPVNTPAAGGSPPGGSPFGFFAGPAGSVFRLFAHRYGSPGWGCRTALLESCPHCGTAGTAGRGNRLGVDTEKAGGN